MNIWSWEAAEWSAAAEVFFSLGAILAGAWAIHNYRRAKRTEVAKWVKEIFFEFYIAKTFDSIRSKLEYDFEGKFNMLVCQRFFDRDISLSDDEKSLLKDMDTLLNYFEHLLYLERRGQLQKRDRNAIFEYWFDILREPSRAILRRYTGHFGFERVASELKSADKNLIVLYGTLQNGEAGFNELSLGKKLKFISSCTFQGDLRDMGDYPAYITGDGIIHGELFEMTDVSVIKTLDNFERYDARKPEASLYIRKCITLLKPETEAWIYKFNEDASDKPLISSGNWKTHQASI